MNKRIPINSAAFVLPILVVVLALGFALYPLARGELFFYWDNAQQHYVQTVFLDKVLGERSIPEWWPDVGLGFPTIAEGQSAHFHPIRLLTAMLFSAHAAFMIEVAVYFAVAGISTYFFLRHLRIRAAPAFLGAITFIFGSYSIVSVDNIAIYRGLFLFPLAVLLAHRYVNSRDINHSDKVVSVFVASFVFAVQFLAGHPAMAIITAVGTTAYVLCHVLQRSLVHDVHIRYAAKSTGLQLCGWAFAVLLGLGIAAIQVVPTLKQVDESIRAGGLTFQYAVIDSLPSEPRFLYQFLFPYAYNLGEWLPEKTSWGSYFNQVPFKGIYLGTLPLILAALSIWWHRGYRDPVWALAICALLGTLLATGAKTPLYPALWSMPGLNGMRFPFRFLLMPAFFLSCLAAVGFQRLIARSRGHTVISRDLLPILIMGIGILYFAIRLYHYPRRFIANISIAPDLQSGVLQSLALSVIALILCGLILFSRRRGRHLLVACCLAFVLTDLAMFRQMANYAPTVSVREVLDPPPIAKFLLRDESQFRVMSLVSLESGLNKNEDLSEFMQANTSALWGIYNAGVFGSLLMKRHYAIYESIVWELSNAPESAAKLAPYLGALNIKYIIAPEDLNLVGFDPVFRSERSTIWRNPAVLPRVFLVENVLSEEIEERGDWWFHAANRRLARYHEMIRDWWSRISEVQIVDNILSQEIDYTNTAIVDGGTLMQEAVFSAEGRILSQGEDVDGLRFVAENSQAAFAVVSTSYHPGWSAFINGKPAEVYRTNYLTIGVHLPPGVSEVVLEFSTPGLRTGALVSISSFATGALFVGLLVYRRRMIALRRSWLQSSPNQTAKRDSTK